MIEFKDWLRERWEKIGYEECPDHLRKAFKSGNPIDLPFGIGGEWNTYKRLNQPPPPSQRQSDPQISAQLRDWLKERWETIGFTECPEHLLDAFESGEPSDLPVLIKGEWNVYRRMSDPVEREKRLNDPSLNAEIWEIHIERLRRFRCSTWQGRMYFLGKRGGLYYICDSGSRVYV